LLFSSLIFLSLLSSLSSVRATRKRRETSEWLRIFCPLSSPSLDLDREIPFFFFVEPSIEPIHLAVDILGGGE
ncbi:hypothetical protein PENTCL1PPCAC_11986, partial [Pristionchus entomophagus]